MLTTLEEKFYPGYLAALVLLYILVIALYILLTLALIKKMYTIPPPQKNGWWLVRNGFCNTWNQCCENPQRPGWLYSTIRFASLSSYFISLLCILGAFHLVKYFMIKKWEKTDNNKRKDIRV